MPTELKIILTSVIIWLIAHLAAYPGSPFAKWGNNTPK